MKDSLVNRDLNHIWHPCSQMKDYENFPPLEIISASGIYLHLPDGKKLIDAISSWWCKTLGHGHPRLREALLQQVNRFEHVISANTSNETLVELSEKLTGFFPSLSKVFYAGEGSMAVEIAVKMALQAKAIQTNGVHSKGSKKTPTRLMALENGYHGETALTLALGDLGIYREAYQAILPPVLFLRGIPYVYSEADPLWSDCSSVWPAIEKQLDKQRLELCAIVFEPILQGAGGMRLYSADFLKRLRAWTLKNNVFLIADEILSGFGRTGKMFACEHAGIVPDFMCLSKGLTAGWLPMSAVLISQSIYEEFYADYGQGRDFLHSNTYAGNALAAAVALETLKIYQDENILSQVQTQSPFLRSQFEKVAQATGRLKNIRSIGGMVAGDLILDDSVFEDSAFENSAFPHSVHRNFPRTANPKKRAGFQVYQAAVERGALLRNLGDTLYWLLPLNAQRSEIEDLGNITEAAIHATFAQ